MTKDERTLRCRATPEQVWRAFADPDIIAGWFADEARGKPEPGDALTHVFRHFGMEMSMEVLEAKPGELLVLEGSGPGGFAFRQEVRVRAEGGETVLSLVHSGFDDDDESDWADEYEGMDSGWKLALAILRHYLENHFGRPKQTYMAMRPASFDYASLPALYTREEGLSRWLSRSGAIGEVGDRYRLELSSGETASGEVLAWSGREAALSWKEIRGTLELKAFDAGPEQRMLALRAFSWHDSPPAQQELEGFFGERLEQLARSLQA